jgi:hypothetical protein
MRKFYVITAQFSSANAELAMKKFLSNFRSHLALTPNSWLVAAGSSASTLCSEIQEVAGEDATIFVAGLGAATAWSKNPSYLASWLPRQLAAVSY